MLQLKNTTPFAATITVFPNEKAIDTLYVVMKATFTLGNRIKAADSQLPIFMAEEYWGEPGLSSLKYASELHLTKPSTDVVMIGKASAVDKRPTTMLDVRLEVADRKKVVRVFGDRQWVNGEAGQKMSSPEPFESLPLVYERAYGGVHEVDPIKPEVLFEERNPIGRGFKGKRTESEMKGTMLPNLEDPAKLIRKPEDRPPPACFGYIAPSWKPRKLFSGTYDEAWQQKGAPYLPEDFDSRFFNAAHPDMVCKGYLKGGEPVFIQNMSHAGPLKFTLPVCELETAVRIAGNTTIPPLNLETVLLEPSESRMSLLWRAAVACDKKALKVEQIDIRQKKSS